MYTFSSIDYNYQIRIIPIVYSSLEKWLVILSVAAVDILKQSWLTREHITPTYCMHYYQDFSINLILKLQRISLNRLIWSKYFIFNNFL